MTDQNKSNGAPGTSPALPTAEDIVRNERERRQAIGQKARKLIKAHIEQGKTFQPADFRGFGKDGLAYFSKHLRTAVSRQFRNADQTPPSPRVNSQKKESAQLLVETAHWHALERPRKPYAVGPKVWGLWAALGVGLVSFGLAEFGLIGAASETLGGLFHVLMSLSKRI